MNTQLISSLKLIATRLSAVLVLTLLLVVPACARQSQPARIEELTFQSGEFTLVGDLRTPAGTGPFPVVLFVHGSGDADRTMFGMYLFGMLTFMFNWNAYLWPLIVLTEQKVRTLPILLTWYSNQHDQQLHLTMAASVLVILPVLFVFILTQRWIVKGITLTGIK